LPLWQPSGPRLKAIVFDVDGTLYDQTQVRLAMVRRLLMFCARHPVQGLQTVRILREFRLAQERLRKLTDSVAEMGLAQEAETARRLDLSIEVVRQCVMRWMEFEPLDTLRSARRDGVVETVAAARRRGLKLGICSDYPAAGKIAALQLHHAFDAIVCAQDADVQRFKPDPRGLLIAIGRLGVRPEEALYVGDRPDVDALAASRAGVASVMVARRASRSADRASGPVTYTCRALAEALNREAL
jgi:phosphoglycolate phosphatase/putative hydrolase of the HAD superfamily